MIVVDVRPSLRILQQISAIERFAGRWEYSLSGSVNTTNTSLELALLKGVIAICELDQTVAPASLLRVKELTTGLSSRIEIIKDSRKPETPDLETNLQNFSAQSVIRNSWPTEVVGLLNCHLTQISGLSLGGLDRIHRVISGDQSALLFFNPELSEKPCSERFRQTPSRFCSPNNELIFATVPAFLIEQRLNDLLEWTNQELEAEKLHPLLIAGIFHLLLLQLSPYPNANLRLAAVLLWQVLDQSGYSFVRENHFAKEFNLNRVQYFNSLRQAEKTVHGSWATLNVWLEFFLQSFVASCEQIEQMREVSLKKSRLSSVQLNIIDSIRNSGSATREKIVKDTGINISTVKYNLSILAARGHLRREGGGRATSYSLI